MDYGTRTLFVRETVRTLWTGSEIKAYIISDIANNMTLDKSTSNEMANFAQLDLTVAHFKNAFL